MTQDATKAVMAMMSDPQFDAREIGTECSSRVNGGDVWVFDSFQKPILARQIGINRFLLALGVLLTQVICLYQGSPNKCIVCDFLESYLHHLEGLIVYLRTCF